MTIVRFWRLVTALVFLVSAANPQATLSLDQLVSFVQSSIKLRHPDKQVAGYLQKLKLTERLEDRTIEELQGLGAGQKTVDALRMLRDATQSLPRPTPKAPRVAPAPIPPPSPTEQTALLHEVREYSLNYSKTLPDFICTQVTRRYYDPSGLEFWLAADTLTTRLSYFEQKENYKLVMINNTLTERPYESLGGATSTGEFGSMLREIFDPDSQGKFQWERWATLRGRRAHVFSYRIPQPSSKWRISFERQMEIVTGYRGEVFVDKENSMVLRITLDAEDIPPSFPIRQASTVLDYDYTKISEREYLLPLRAVVRLRQEKLLTKNDVEFRMYRKFAAESTITFTPDPLTEDQTKEQTPEPPPK